MGGALASPTAVQISNVNGHHAVLGRSGVLGILIFFAGIALIAYGLIPIVKPRLWLSTARPVRGWVIDNVQRSWSLRTKSWSPIVEYEIAGTMLVARLSSVAAPQGWPVGMAVDLFYDSSDPRRIRIAENQSCVSEWLIIGLGVVGIFLAATA